MIKLFFTKPLYTIFGVVYLALAAALGIQTVRLYKAHAAHADTKASHAVVLKDLAAKTKKAYEQVQLAQAQMQQRIEHANQKHYKELSHAQAKNDELRAAVRAGTASVRIKGHCVRHTDTVPKTPSTRSVGNAKAAVDADLSERVLVLRGQVIQAEKQIAYLQDYARTCRGGA